jgi:DsbC/DsbD-like thiol-disulfide interchange protein
LFIRIWLVAGLLFWSLAASAEKDFSSWRKFSTGQLVGETSALTPGTGGTIGLLITLAEGWHTYWVNPGDSGAAIRLKFRTSPGLKVREVSFPRPKRYESGPLVSFGYSKRVLL